MRRARLGATAAGRTGAPVFILIVPLFHVTGNVPVFLGSLASGLKLVIRKSER